MHMIIEKNGLVEYHPSLFSLSQSLEFFTLLEKEIAWEADVLTIFGKKIITKRKVAWYGDAAFEYIYSNSSKIALPWTHTLQTIKTHLENYTGEQFNSCLLNIYHNGSESMGWHSDDEAMMKKHAPIASISLGAQRTFVFQHKISKEKQSIELENGSLLLMKDATQDYWKHHLPIRKRIKTPRINSTFRQFDITST